MSKPTELTKAMAGMTPAVRKAVIRLAKRGVFTKVGAREALNSMAKSDRGGLTLSDGEALLSETAYALRQRRSEKRSRSYRVTVNQAPRITETIAYHEYLNLPLARRIKARSNNGLIKASRRVLKHGASAGSQIDVEFVDAFTDTAYGLDTEKVWDHYGGSYRNYPALRDVHTPCIRPTWCLEVARIGDGSGVVADRLILAVDIDIPRNDGRAIYRVRTAKPGRGFSAVIEDLVASCWDNHCTLHRDYRRALAEKMPASVRDARRLRIDEERARRKMERADADALADIHFAAA